jgi:hypothetical protein
MVDRIGWNFYRLGLLGRKFQEKFQSDVKHDKVIVVKPNNHHNDRKKVDCRNCGETVSTSPKNTSQLRQEQKQQL